MKLLIHYNNATFDMGYVISPHTLPGMLLLTGIYVKPYQQNNPWSIKAKPHQILQPLWRLSISTFRVYVPNSHVSYNDLKRGVWSQTIVIVVVSRRHGSLCAFCPCQKCKFKTLRYRQIGRRFADDFLKCIFLTEDVWILISISSKCVPGSPFKIFQHWFR